ncbi:hypothetical protein NPIL_137551 [Nephila pilipes]|uniref:Uncharacterized protein n=1 Tax=Nephila pilipes TaxID=299642 RepID=A0A8X6NEN5_NEPPI|nr:hypothetical protein NPIL_137551 [Nephila pilipes]
MLSLTSPPPRNGKNVIHHARIPCYIFQIWKWKRWGEERFLVASSSGLCSRNEIMLKATSCLVCQKRKKKNFLFLLNLKDLFLDRCYSFTFERIVLCGIMMKINDGKKKEELVVS